MSASTKRGRNGSEDSEDGASGDASENEDLDAGAPEEDAEGRAAAAKQRRMAINRRTAHSSRIRKKQVREDGGEEEEIGGEDVHVFATQFVCAMWYCVCVCGALCALRGVRMPFPFLPLTRLLRSFFLLLPPSWWNRYSKQRPKSQSRTRSYVA